MKKFKKLSAMVALTAAMLTFTQVPAFAAEAPVAQPQKQIIVHGTGIVNVTPDMATLRFGVETLEKTAKAAQDKNAAVTDKVISQLIQAGIAKDKITTNYYSVNPQYRYNDETGERVLTGYQAYNSFSAITSDVNNTGKYIDIAIKAGANNNDGVSFSLSNPNKYYTQALKLALENASSNASAIASALGTTVGAPVQITEQSSYFSYTEEANYLNTNAMTKQSVSADIAGGADIRYDKIKVTANLDAVFTY
ncbi:MAG: SIMPL domain-containing protein [Epulopiscium sp.]|jgi:uncharacterized protein YggE|nr:SIMPL domain-containing protein [Candidatus Epulonipiscium sp.]